MEIGRRFLWAADLVIGVDRWFLLRYWTSRGDFMRMAL